MIASPAAMTIKGLLSCLPRRSARRRESEAEATNGIAAGEPESAIRPLRERARSAPIGGQGVQRELADVALLIYPAQRVAPRLTEPKGPIWPLGKVLHLAWAICRPCIGTCRLARSIGQREFGDTPIDGDAAEQTLVNVSSG